MNPDAVIQWHSYVRREKYDVLMNFLVHEKYGIDQQDEEGQTALHLACEVSQTTIRVVHEVAWVCQTATPPKVSTLI